MDPQDRSEVENILSGGDLATLLDLQKFLAEELAHGSENGVDVSRAFMPLTDGLGIGRAKGSPSQKPSAASQSSQSGIVDVRSAADVVSESEAEAEAEFGSGAEYGDEEVLGQNFDLQKNPPPVPHVSIGRRFLAGLVDQCFIFTSALLALAITSNAMASGGTELAARFLKEFSNPAFVRSAALEYFVIWLGYLALSFGFLEMTFGMWVWGTRVAYGEQNRFSKKVARVLAGLFFYPLIAPCLLLIIQRNGKNLVDGLTRTEIYRA